MWVILGKKGMCFDCLPWVQTARFLPLLPWHFSVFFCQPGHRWTAYLAGTNHIWLLSVTVNYTLCASCPPATTQWKRSYSYPTHPQRNRHLLNVRREVTLVEHKLALGYNNAFIHASVHSLIDLTCLFLLMSIGKQGWGREGWEGGVYLSR